MHIAGSMEELIGRTPLVRLSRIESAMNLHARLMAKVELFNPSGSVKDRVALNIICEAEKSGRLAPGGVIIEPTSGNTGIGLALIAAIRGYRAIMVMPDNMSEERRMAMTAYGAEPVLTPAQSGMPGAIAKAQELAASIPGSIIAGQFANPANPQAHFATTGPEIWDDTDGAVDFFIAGVGTGGTITGAGRYLKSKNPNIRIVAVEPSGSAVLSGKPAGKHGLQGIGAGFIPQTLDTSVYDSVMTVTEEQAYETGRLLCSKEGILCGITSGAAAWAAIKLASNPANEGKSIVCLLPDSGMRYLSTPMFRA